MTGKTGTRLLCIALMATSLGGCGRALELLGLRHEAKPEVKIRTADAQSAAAAVSEGRVHLGAGRTGLAIEHFQRALAAGGEMGPAANGMGIAYARLGQFEQAHRFFAEALAVDPQNEKYQANMARLMRSSLLAKRHETDFVAQVAARTLTGAHDLLSGSPEPKMVATADRATETTARLATVPGARTGMTRVSRGEVMIRTAAPGSDARGGALPLVGARGSKADSFKPAVRIEFSDQGRAGNKPAATGEEASEEVPAKTANADVGKFTPLVRIDFPTARNKP